MTGHEYGPSVPNCAEHGMGDCPHHAGGPCQWRPDGQPGVVCGRNEADHATTTRTPRLLPVEQYRVTLLVTGNDIDADVLTRYLRQLRNSSGHAWVVEGIQKIGS